MTAPRKDQQKLKSILAQTQPSTHDSTHGDFEAALVQEILDSPQREWVAHGEHRRQADDFWRGPEVPEREELGPSARLGDLSARLYQSSSETVSSNEFLHSRARLAHSGNTRLGHRQAEAKTATGGR